MQDTDLCSVFTWIGSVCTWTDLCCRMGGGGKQNIDGRGGGSGRIGGGGITEETGVVPEIFPELLGFSFSTIRPRSPSPPTLWLGRPLITRSTSRLKSESIAADGPLRVCGGAAHGPLGCVCGGVALLQGNWHFVNSLCPQKTRCLQRWNKHLLIWEGSWFFYDLDNWKSVIIFAAEIKWTSGKPQWLIGSLCHLT